MVFHVLLAYGLPDWLFASLVIILGILPHWCVWRGYGFADTRKMITVAYGLALKITGLEDSIYYRPDEKYVRFDYTNNHRVYQSNVHLDRVQRPPRKSGGVTRGSDATCGCRDRPSLLSRFFP